MDMKLPYRPSLQAEELEKPFYAHSRDSHAADVQGPSAQRSHPRFILPEHAPPGQD